MAEALCSIPVNVCVCVHACRANSVAWNPHKLMLAGLQCSALLLKDTTVCIPILRLSIISCRVKVSSNVTITCHALISQGLLKQCHCAKATYLFQQDKFYDVNLDIGDKSLQCSRKVDCLKLWLMWKAIGSSGLEERINKAFVNARYALSTQHYAMQLASSHECYESRNQNLVKVCLFCRYFVEEMKKRKGFHLLHEVKLFKNHVYFVPLDFF